MRRVHVFFLGGTISMTGAADALPGAGLRPDLAGGDLLAALPLPDGVRSEAVDVARLDSSALTFAVCLETFARAEEAVRRGEADGVVVVQGTDTLEETAYLWDLLWPHPQPFVVTGAMRPPEAAGADGPANLLAAIMVAAADEAGDLGVLAVLGDEIHTARHVTKAHATSPAAFGSPDLGPVGRVHEGRARLDSRVPRLPTLPAPTREVAVGLVRASLDDDPELYRAVAGVSEGLVVEGFGAGQVRPEVAEVLVETAAAMPVVLVSRTGAGRVASRTYAGPGSGSRLLAGGLVDGGRLGGLRARVLLRALLGSGCSRADIVETFADHGR